MKRGLIAVAAVAVVVVAVLATALLVPGIARSGAEALASRALRHPVEITGPFRVFLWPRFGVAAEDVRVLGSLGGPDMVRLKRFEAEISLVSLLAARIEIGRLALIEPAVRIEVDARPGDAAGEGRRQRDWQPRPNPDWGLIRGARIGEGRVTGGRILYVDVVSRRRLEANRIEATLGMPADGGPFVAEGSLLLNDRTVTWKVDGAGMRQLLTGGGMKLAAEARSDFASIEFQGTVARRQLLVFDGRAALTAPSAAAIDRWIGPLFAVPVEGPLEAQARLVFSGARFAIEQARLTLGEMRARGEGAATFTGDRPSLSMQVAAELLDLTPFLFLGSRDGRADGATRPQRPGNDVDVRIEWQALKLGHLRGGPGRLAMKGSRKGGASEAELSIADIFGGEISARARLTGDHETGSLEGRAVLSRLQAEAILGPLVGEAPLAGTVNGTVTVSADPGAGSVLKRLTVNGAVTMPAARVLSARLAESLASSTGGGREIADLSFKFSTSEGRLGFEDVVVRGIGGSLVGGGELDFASGRLDLLLRRPAGEGDVGGIRIAGPWDMPEITPAPLENAR